MTTTFQCEQDIGADRGLAEHASINIDGTEVEWFESFKFLVVNLTNKLSWSKHTKTVVKRARQHLFPLLRLKRFGMGPQILKKFYSCTSESILTGCITAWYGNCSASDGTAPQRYWAVRTTLCSVLRSDAKQLPYLSVMQCSLVQL